MEPKFNRSYNFPFELLLLLLLLLFYFAFLADSSNLNSETSVLYSTLLLINSMILVELLYLGFPNSSARLMICNFQFYIFTLTKISTLNESFPDHLWMTAEQSIDYLKKCYNLVAENKINPGGFSYSEEEMTSD